MCSQPSVGPPPRCPPDSPHVTGAEPRLKDSAHTGTYVAVADDGDLHSPANLGDVDSEYFGPRPRSYSDSDPISVEDGVITVPGVNLSYGRPPGDPIPAGAYELRLENRGDLGHTLVNDDLGIDLVATARQQAATTVDLPPGEYLFYCRISGLRDAGMELKLVAK